MKAQTTSNGQGLENSDINAEETHSKLSGKDEIVKRREVENTPFVMVSIGDQHFVTMGKYRLTPPQTEEECNQWITELSWDKVLSVVHIMVETHLEYREMEQSKERLQKLADERLKDRKKFEKEGE